MRLVRVWTLFVTLLLAALAGCEADPMVRAQAAHAGERADEAEAALKQVLAQDPKSFEARRLMADIPRFRGEFAKSEEALEALWKEKQFDQEKQLPDEERAQRDLLENQFNELYAKWSEALDPAKEPEKFEKVVRAGLKWKKKSPTLNRLLTEHLLARGEALAKEGKKLEAAATYEEMLQLQAMPDQRRQAEEKAAALRREAFADDVRAKFDPVKAELGEGWDQATGTIRFSVEADVDKRLRQNKDADLEKARKEATAAVKSGVAQWVARVTGVTATVAARAQPKMTSGDEKLARGKYSVNVSIVLDDMIAAAYDAALQAERLARQAPKTADGGAEEAPTDPPATNAGSGEDDDAPKE